MLNFGETQGGVGTKIPEGMLFSMVVVSGNISKKF